MLASGGTCKGSHTFTPRACTRDTTKGHPRYRWRQHSTLPRHATIRGQHWSEALEMKPASVCAKASTRVIALRRPLRRAATPRAATSLPQSTTTTPSKFAAVIKHTERACAASRDRPVILGFRDDLEGTASSDLIVCSLPRFRFSPPDQLVCNGPSCNSGPYPATAETAFLPRL